MIMEEWKEYKLGDIVIPIKDRIDTSVLDRDTYISTENMLPNKSGITSSSGVPSGSAVRFQEGDVLISNIRPYFKKIWRADFVGGCSADVICLRATNRVEPLLLFYMLSQDLFFDYVMQGAKGTKMPRGDKSQIMQWPVFLPPINEQKQIASILKSLDDKKLTIKVPEGTANGKLLRIKGEGVPVSGSSRKGDLYVKIIVQVPSKLSSKQKEILKQYLELENPPKEPQLINRSKLGE